jgi:hypothetical protein
MWIGYSGAVSRESLMLFRYFLSERIEIERRELRRKRRGEKKSMTFGSICNE